MNQIKHFFFIHSNLTYLMSLAIILEEKIPRENVIIFSEKFNYDYLPIKTKKLNQKQKIHKLKLFLPFRRVRQIDKQIDSYSSDSRFIVYMQSMLQAQKIFVTHPLCSGIRFFEEGMANYYKHDSIYSLSIYNRNLKWRLDFKNVYKQVRDDLLNSLQGYSKKLRNLPSWPTCYFNFDAVKYYSFSQNAFRGIPSKKKNILSFRNILDSFEYDLEIPEFDEVCFWLSDNILRSYKVEKEEYLGIIKNGFETLLKTSLKLDTLYIKFHQAESKDLREATLDVFKSLNIQYTIIEDGIPMELILLKSKKCHVIGIMTSLLYYAAIMNHNIYSLRKRFNINSYFDFSDALGDEYKVTYI